MPRKFEPVLFMGGAVLLCATVIATAPPLRDPDSTLYAAMSSQLARGPLSGWLVPEWPSGRMKTGRFVEHTAVTLWPGAALETLGFSSGALATNAVAAVLLLWLVGRLAAALAPKAEPLAWLAWGGCLVGIQFWLRANHEIWWATATVGALLAVATRSSRWVVVACTLCAFAVKGPLGLDTVLVVAPLALVMNGRRWVALYLAFAVVAFAAFVAAYDLLYRRATGSSFLSEYFSIQFGYVEHSENGSILAKPRNLIVYGIKLVWFSLPGALLLLWALWKRGRASVDSHSIRALLGGIAVVLVATSLMSRQAGRYIFPCYPMLAVVGATSVAHTRLAEWVDRHRLHVLGLIMLIALGRVLLARLVYTDINILPGTKVGAARGGPQRRRRPGPFWARHLGGASRSRALGARCNAAVPISAHPIPQSRAAGVGIDLKSDEQPAATAVDKRANEYEPCATVSG
jgi:hypothetical protein